jgi:hypothetical protein
MLGRLEMKPIGVKKTGKGRAIKKLKHPKGDKGRIKQKKKN